MRLWLPILLLSLGCTNENDLLSSLPPAAIANPRPLETATQTDKLVQVQVPEVDIIWVVDNSCSMGDEQNQLAANFPIFMSYFLNSGLDYHIGMTTTDMTNSGARGILQPARGYRYIDSDTVDPEAVFAEITGTLGTGGDFTEKGRDAAYGAIEVQDQPYMPNDGFTREDASLNIVVISDENDYSTDIGLQEFISYLDNLKWDSEMVSFSSIVSEGNGCDVEQGSDYIAVTNAVGGEMESICAENWEPMLDRLGLQAAGLRREYFLSQLPVPSSISVWVEEETPAGIVTLPFEEETDWLYNQNRNSIEFISYVPNALSSVFVEYEVLSASEEEL